MEEWPSVTLSMFLIICKANKIFDGFWNFTTKTTDLDDTSNLIIDRNFEINQIWNLKWRLCINCVFSEAYDDLKFTSNDLGPLDQTEL